MDVEANGRATDPQDSIICLVEQANPPRIARIDHTVELVRARRREPNQRRHVVVAADYSVERHDVSGGDARRKGHEVAMLEGDAGCQPPALSLLARGGEISRGGIYIDRLTCTGLQQGM